jgi:hypothetical protein
VRSQVARQVVTMPAGDGWPPAAPTGAVMI